MAFEIVGYGYVKRGGSIQGGGRYGVFLSQSFQGGGRYGVFSSQSIQGGGSVSGINMVVHNNGTNGTTWGGFFFKVASFPAGDMTLVDLNGGPTGFIRLKMTSVGHIVLEEAYRGGSYGADLTPASGITVGTWYWAYFVMGNNSSEAAHLRVRGQVYGPGGASEGQQTVDYPYASGDADSLTATVGWGVSQSSGYLNFPNIAGNELSKLEVFSGAVDASALTLPAPSSDPSVSGQQVLYLCRDATGPHSTIVDSTANHFDLSAGPNGITVVLDGPYA